MKRSKKTPSHRPDHPSLARARKLASLMDSAFTIPIINKKIGLDPLLDLLPIPLSGDLVGTLVAVYLVYVAVELRLPRHIILRMGLNILVDLLFGAIPVAGFVLDAIWKSNAMNLKLLEEGYQQYGVGAVTEPNGTTTVDVLVEPV